MSCRMGFRGGIELFVTKGLVTTTGREPRDNKG